MIEVLEKNNWIAWVFVVFIAGFIFYISSLTFTVSLSPSSNSLRATVYHIGIFFLFSMFLMIATSKGKKMRWVLFSVVISFLYAVSDEFHQSFVPGRDASAGDIFLDSVGIAFAFLIYWIRFEFRN